METLWEFETRHFLFKLEIEQSVAPDTSWMDEEQVDAHANGDLYFFDSILSVYGPRNELIGQDVLGESCYYLGNVKDFVTAHRDSNPMNRNCSIMRREKGKVTICHYFPGMVSEAIAEARQNIKTMRKTYNNLYLRAA